MMRPKLRWRDKLNPAQTLFKYTVLGLIMAIFFIYNIALDEGHPTESNEVVMPITHLGTSRRFNAEDDDDDDECSPKNKEDPCMYIHETEGCEPDGKINYLDLYYCKLYKRPWAAYIVLCLWMVALFFVLGKTADYFFCPSLEVLSEALHMSPELGGLTLMALGNGAPDVSSVIAGVVGSNSFQIAIGELFGSGLFVTSVIFGIVLILTKKVKVNPKDFMRDILFYIVAVSCIFFFTWDCYITLAESIIFLLYYIGYVVFAVVVHYCFGGAKTQIEEKAYPNEETPLIQDYEYQSDGSSIMDESEDELEYFTLSGWFNWWLSKGLFHKIYIVITSIVFFPIMISVPGVKWNRYQAVLVPVTSIPVIFLVIDKLTSTVRGFPIVFIVMLCMIVLSIAILLTTAWEFPPKYSPIFQILCFALSVAWIYVSANELVSLLKSLGILLNISQVIMGATVLAWGNSLGDLVSNITVTRQGNPRMALSATYGGPLFNLLVGLGCAMLIKNIQLYPRSFNVNPDHHVFTTTGFLFFALYITIVIAFFGRFKLKRYLGIGMIALYVAFSVIILLIELKIVWPTTSVEVCVPWRAKI